MPGSVYSSGTYYIYFLRERGLKISSSFCAIPVYACSDSSKKLIEEKHILLGTS
jgi:hypothetical protein